MRDGIGRVTDAVTHMVEHLRAGTTEIEVWSHFHQSAVALGHVEALWRERHDRFHSRNPFPVGGVVEDPATGAAAAALGGYLRAHQYIQPPSDRIVIQGVDMVRPSHITVQVPSTGGIKDTGTASRISTVR